MSQINLKLQTRIVPSQHFLTVYLQSETGSQCHTQADKARMASDVELEGLQDVSLAEDTAMAQLLPFERQMVEELLDEDGLCVMAAGLSWQRVAAVLLRLQYARCRQPGQGGAMLILGATEAQRATLQAELLRLNQGPAARHAFPEKTFALRGLVAWR